MFHFYTPWKRQKTKGFNEILGENGLISNNIETKGNVYIKQIYYRLFKSIK